MELKLALELGQDCGLSDLGECILNIRMRVGQLFEVEDYNELCKNYRESGLNLDQTIEECLEAIK